MDIYAWNDEFNKIILVIIADRNKNYQIKTICYTNPEGIDERYNIDKIHITMEQDFCIKQA